MSWFQRILKKEQTYDAIIDEELISEEDLKNIIVKGEVKDLQQCCCNDYEYSGDSPGSMVGIRIQFLRD